jgi:hypothetical protein
MSEKKQDKPVENKAEVTRKSWRDRLVPAFLLEYVQIWRKEGFRALIKKKGWKVVVLIICYYLVRDSILYILIPYLIARGIFS